MEVKDILDKALYLYYYSHIFSGENDIVDINEVLTHKNSIVVGGYNENIRYMNDRFNVHHYTTDYQYNIVMPLLSHIFNMGYNIKDFHKVSNILETGDYSYIIPNTDKNFVITASSLYTSKDSKGNPIIGINYDDTKDYGNFEHFVNVDRVFNTDTLNYLGWSVPKGYHTLFKYSHQPCIIDNLSDNNGKTMLISCDSHIIPLIMIISYFYKRVIVLDNRYDGFTFEDYYINANIDEVIIEFNPSYPYKKYIEYNFK